jgi:hypothetical protein
MKQIIFPKESDWHMNLATHFHVKISSYASKMPSNCMVQCLIWQKDSFTIKFHTLSVACVVEGMDGCWLEEGERGERKKKERKKERTITDDG